MTSLPDHEHKSMWCEKHKWYHDDMRVCLDDPECCTRSGCTGPFARPDVQAQLASIVADLEEVTKAALKDAPRVGERFHVGSYEKHELYATIREVQGTLFINYDAVLKVPVEYIRVNLIMPEEGDDAVQGEAEADGQAG